MTVCLPIESHQFFVGVLVFLALNVIFHLHAQHNRMLRVKATAQDYIFKIARVTGKSEYDVFVKSAENWPVSDRMIDEHFKDYLLTQQVPFYVKDFINKNKRQIDALRLPPW